MGAHGDSGTRQRDMAAEEFLGTEERCFSCLHNGVVSFPGTLTATKEKCELPVVPVLTHDRPGSIPGTTQPPEHGGLQRDSHFRAWDLGTENPVPTSWQGVKVVYIPRRAKMTSWHRTGVVSSSPSLGGIWVAKTFAPSPRIKHHSSFGSAAK